MIRMILAGALALGLSACQSLTAEEEQALRDGIAQAAIDMIAQANAEGINPVEMEPAKLRVVHFACSAATAFAPFVDAYIEARNVNDPDFEPVDFKGYVAAACAVAHELIQPAAPEAAPEPDPKPA